MPTYEYKCDKCGVRAEVVDEINGTKREDWDAGKIDHIREVDTPCGTMKRVFSFSTPPVMQEHYNAAVGKPISSMRQFKDELKRSSDALEDRTGVPHDLQPVDVSDKQALGVDDAGLAATHDARVKAGLQAPTGNKVFRLSD